MSGVLMNGEIVNGLSSSHFAPDSSDEFLPFFDFRIDEANAFEGAKRLLRDLRKDWNTDDDDQVTFTVFTDGYTNKLIACMHRSDVETKKDVVLVRIYGHGTDQMIDRKQERRSMMVFHHIGCAAPLYGRFRNGIVYGYSPGVVVTLNLVHQPNVKRLIARQMALMHTVDLDVKCNSSGDGGVHFNQKPCIFPVLYKWMELIPRYDDEATQARFIDTFKSKEHLKNEIDELQEELWPLGSPVVLCHNDLLFKNIIYNEEQQKVTFIDFEYVAFNYQAFDIANHFCEFAGMDDIDYSRFPDKEYQTDWLRIYLEFYYERQGHSPKEPTDHDIDVLHIQVNKFVLASCLMWALWGLIQAKYSTIGYNYLDFAKGRMMEYYTRKKQCMALKLPSASDIDY